MRRKLVKQGAATLMVSLPAGWAKRLCLRKGDEVHIQELESTLLLSAGMGVEEKRKTKIKLTNQTESAIRTQIVNAYRAGYDIVEVIYSNEEEYKIISNTIKEYLIGFEIVKKEKGYCILENITEPSQEQFDVLIKKIIYNIMMMIDSTEERLRGQTKFENYADIDAKIKQYHNFCARVISKKNPVGSRAPLFWTFLGLLIHGQRDLYHLNKFLDKNQIKFTAFDITAKLKQAFALLSDGYIKKDVSKLEQLHELEKTAIYKDVYKAIQTGKKENIAVFHIAFAIRNFYLASSPLMGLLLAPNPS